MSRWGGKVKDVQPDAREDGREATPTANERESAKTDVMDRRGFLAKSAVAGAVLAGGSLVTGVGSAFAAKPPATLGYRVGDLAADFGGYDQYMKPRKLSDNRGSWVLIDLCPAWCNPCKVSAPFQFNFTQYIRSQGIPFHMQPVVVETAPEGTGPSNRVDAEQWAWRYQLEREALLHCNGDPNSPLRQLADKYAAANNNTDFIRYPTYVLIDPNGVIQYYLAEANLPKVQASLAQKTRITLSEEIVPTSYAPQADFTSGSVSFTLWDGTAVALSAASPLINQYIDTSASQVTIDLQPVLGDPIDLVDGSQIHSRLFDLHSPITMKFHGTITPDPGTYSTVTVATIGPFGDPPQAVFAEYDPAYYGLDIGGVDKGIAWMGTPAYNTDGSIQVQVTPSDSFADPVHNNHWGPDDDARASNLMSFNFGHHLDYPVPDGTRSHRHCQRKPNAFGHDKDDGQEPASGRSRETRQQRLRRVSSTVRKSPKHAHSRVIARCGQLGLADQRSRRLARNALQLTIATWLEGPGSPGPSPSLR